MASAEKVPVQQHNYQLTLSEEEAQVVWSLCITVYGCTRPAGIARKVSYALKDAGVNCMASSYIQKGANCG